ncbi:leucine-rich repeat domain-containing protein [Bacillus sp. S35]|uniref:leucine-rich repeat domain-containing protein n=1 Tax=Priestia aryabhattai TaxID=412384 RepID=UPI00190A5EFF|nr:leucine-rich repeat domain-containing protein [Priestia aryabhattai]MBK0010276.1 leucine-rich repeat domain-containing protein [Bacillus sp. S35]MCM3644502.1 leucine-rich repeat domain-containing protein [Priestia aryabhattai]
MFLFKSGNVKIHKETKYSEEETVYINDKYLDECIEYINRHRVKSLNITNEHYKREDINFLFQCNHIEYLSIHGEYLKDISGIYSLKNLKGLGITSTNLDIDLSHLNTLESLTLSWNKKFKNINQLSNLKGLYIWKYNPGNKNLEEFKELKNLENLHLTQCRVESLQGIQYLNKLNSLDIAYLRSLKSLEGLENLDVSLKFLKIEACKNIEDVSVIGLLKNLEKLSLPRCGELPSINFIKNLKKLNGFSFLGTNVLDGDISPCTRLKQVYFTNKKHYSHKEKDFIKF